MCLGPHPLLLLLLLLGEASTIVPSSHLGHRLQQNRQEGVTISPLCTYRGRHYALYRFLSISNEFCLQVYSTVYNLTALCTILLHWGLDGVDGP